MTIDIAEITRVTMHENSTYTPRGLRYVPRSVSELDSIIARVEIINQEIDIEGHVTQDGQWVPRRSHGRDIVEFTFRGTSHYVDVESARAELRDRKIGEITEE